MHILNIIRVSRASLFHCPVRHLTWLTISKRSEVFNSKFCHRYDYLHPSHKKNSHTNAYFHMNHRNLQYKFTGWISTFLWVPCVTELKLGTVQKINVLIFHHLAHKCHYWVCTISSLEIWKVCSSLHTGPKQSVPNVPCVTLRIAHKLK